MNQKNEAEGSAKESEAQNRAQRGNGNGDGLALAGNKAAASPGENGDPGTSGSGEPAASQRVLEPEGVVHNGIVAKATAFGSAMAEGDGANDIYLWEHGVAVEPWPDPVNGKELLDALEQLIGRFVVMSNWARVAVALWVVHTYAWLLRRVATYVGVESPEKRCGKTTLLTVLCELVNRPVLASNISSPAFFRVIEEKKPTLLIDEADTVLHRSRELRGIMNAGCARKTGYVIRMVSKRAPGQSAKSKVQGLKPEIQGPKSGVQSPGPEVPSAKPEERNAEAGLAVGRFSSYCPKAIAMIKHLPEVLADRCVVIKMQRKGGEDKCERVRHLDGVELRRKCARFVQDHAEAIARAQPELPVDLNDRAADIWEPLLALAELAGGDWPEKARSAAVGLTAVAQEESPTGALLLDLIIIFVRQGCAPGNEWMKEHGGVRMFSREIVNELNALPDRPWMVLRRGKEVTERWLSQQLSPYGVRPRTVWIRETCAKGYMEGDLKETFQRYIPKSMARAFRDDQLAAQAAKPALPPKPPEPETRAPDPGWNLAALNEQLRLLRQAAKRRG